MIAAGGQADHFRANLLAEIDAVVQLASRLSAERTILYSGYRPSSRVFYSSSSFTDTF
jgi:hypothetical protein